MTSGFRLNSILDNRTATVSCAVTGERLGDYVDSIGAPDWRASIGTLFASAPVVAQAPTGIILGTVSDATGAIIPNATVTITNKDTGASRKVISTAAGAYSVPSLEPGQYEVRCEVEGFRTMVQNTTVTAGGTFTVNVALTVGQTREVVNVEATAAQVDYESHTVSGVVERNTIQDLPVNGRNFLALAALEPGVTVTPATTNQLNTTFNISILGGLAFGTYITIDGGSVQNNIEGGTSQNFSQEVIQEFQLSSVNFDLSTGITSVARLTSLRAAAATTSTGARISSTATTTCRPIPA